MSIAASMKTVNDFIETAKTLKRSHITPLLRKEVESALKAHREHDPDKLLCDDGNLAPLRQQIIDHWTRLFSIPRDFSVSMNRIDSFANTFVRLLQREYYNLKPPSEKISVSGYILYFGDSQQRQQAAAVFNDVDGSDLDERFERAIGFVVEELCLDLRHVVFRLRSACIDDVAQISRCEGDTARMKELIEKDRKVLQQIVAYREFYGPFRDAIERGMQRLLHRSRAEYQDRFRWSDVTNLFTLAKLTTDTDAEQSKMPLADARKKKIQ